MLSVEFMIWLEKIFWILCHDLLIKKICTYKDKKNG